MKKILLIKQKVSLHQVILYMGVMCLSTIWERNALCSINNQDFTLYFKKIQSTSTNNKCKSKLYMFNKCTNYIIILYNNVITYNKAKLDYIVIVKTTKTAKFY
jgi:hypothetical protein